MIIIIILLQIQKKQKQYEPSFKINTNYYFLQQIKLLKKIDFHFNCYFSFLSSSNQIILFYFFFLLYFSFYESIHINIGKQINKIINILKNNISFLKSRFKLRIMQIKTLPFGNQQNLTLELRNFHQNNRIRQKSPCYKQQNADEKNQNSINKKLTFKDINAYALEANSQNDSQSQIDIDQENDIVNDLDAQYNLKNLRTSLTKQSTLSHKQRVFRANCNKIQGNNYFKQNNFEDSIDQYKEGLSLLNPEQFYNSSPEDFFQMSELSSNILFNMGTCYFVLMSYKEAIKYYNQSILIKPTYVKAIHKRAQAKFQLGKYEQALVDLENAHSLDRNNISISLLLKKVIQKLNKIQHMTESLTAVKVELIENPSQQQKTVTTKKPFLSQSLIVDKITRKNQFFYKCQNESVNHPQEIKLKPDKKEFNFQNLGGKKQRYSLSPQPIASRFGKQSPKFTGNAMYSKNFYKLLVPKKRYTKNNKPSIENKSKSVLMANKNNLFKQEQKKVDKTISYQRQNKKQRKKDENKQQNKMWNFVPFAVFTGIGLYHGVRSFFNK